MYVVDYRTDNISIENVSLLDIYTVKILRIGELYHFVDLWFSRMCTLMPIL